MKDITYQNKEWEEVARHEAMGMGYTEYFCSETNEGMNLWDDGYIEVFDAE